MIPEQRHSGSAGTAGAGYRCDDQGHEYAPRIPDPGERETCRCGRESFQHSEMRAR